MVAGVFRVEDSGRAQPRYSTGLLQGGEGVQHRPEAVGTVYGAGEEQHSNFHTVGAELWSREGGKNEAKWAVVQFILHFTCRTTKLFV
jgi:hypothetical protein